MSRDQCDAAHLDGRKKSGTRMDLTDKERLGRGLDALGEGLRPIVDERMNGCRSRQGLGTALRSQGIGSPGASLQG